MAKLLIVDDEKAYCNVLKVVFEKEGYEVSTAENGKAALEYLSSEPCDLIISDVKMPDLNGIELLQRVREFSSDIRIVLMTAFGTMETAREAFKLGVDDLIQKPFQNDELKLIVSRTLEKQSIIDENRAFRRAQRENGSVKNLIGSSEKMKEVFQMIETVARENSPVFITGESGTGKELIARAIHDTSNRNEKPFIPINCAAMPENLLEAELFGYMKGAFTGANENRKGLFEAAKGGTILLDEIGDMPVLMQVKLLRVLQDGFVRPVGATREIPIDVRVIAVTNSEIEKKIEEGAFRRDLFYRLSVMPIHVPPLRERRGDIAELTKYFVTKFTARSGKKVGIAKEAVDSLEGREWNGNVRELEHVIERAVALTPNGEDIEAAQITKEFQSRLQNTFHLPEEGLHLPTFINDLEREMVEEAIARTEGNQTRAAGILQIPVHAIRHLLVKHEIHTNGEKGKSAELKTK